MVFEFFFGRNRKNVKAAVAIAMIDMREIITVKAGYNRELLATVWFWNRMLDNVEVRARRQRG